MSRRFILYDTFLGGADASLAGGANGCTGLFSGFSFLFILLSCSSARCELAQWCAIRSAEEVSSGGGRRLCTRLPVLWQPGFRPSFAPSLFALTSLWKNINDKRFDRAQATFWALHSLGRTGSAQVCSVNFSRYHGSFWEKEYWVAYFKPVCLIVSSFFFFFFSVLYEVGSDYSQPNHLYQDQRHTAAILLCNDAQLEAQIICCCVPGHKSHKKIDKSLLFHSFLIGYQAKRRWRVKIQRDVGPYFKEKQHVG